MIGKPLCKSSVQPMGAKRLRRDTSSFLGSQSLKSITKLERQRGRGAFRPPRTTVPDNDGLGRSRSKTHIPQSSPGANNWALLFSSDPGCETHHLCPFLRRLCGCAQVVMHTIDTFKSNIQGLRAATTYSRCLDYTRTIVASSGLFRELSARMWR